MAATSEVVDESLKPMDPKVESEDSEEIEIEDQSEDEKKVSDPATVGSNDHGHKLGFSIAQIMGFMGKKKEEAKVEKQEILDDEDEAKPISNYQEGGQQQPQPPKLWRPQPFSAQQASR